MNATPVSYTHLDVYKRQFKWWWLTVRLIYKKVLTKVIAILRIANKLAYVFSTGFSYITLVTKSFIANRTIPMSFSFLLSPIINICLQTFINICRHFCKHQAGVCIVLQEQNETKNLTDNNSKLCTFE